MITREEAIRHFESYVDNECYTDLCQDACRMAISAIRSQDGAARLAAGGDRGGVRTGHGRRRGVQCPDSGRRRRSVGPAG